MYYEISKKLYFEAAHYLPNVPDGHKCKNMHGHSYCVEIFCVGICLTEQGFLVDFADISKYAKPIVELLDHSVINEIGINTNNELLKNPTAENIAKYFYDMLINDISYISKVTIQETPNSFASYVN